LPAVYPGLLEFADHGRPYGGRLGGEFSIQRTQDEPRWPNAPERSSSTQRVPSAGAQAQHG
jgi:hypothetical protein